MSSYLAGRDIVLTIGYLCAAIAAFLIARMLFREEEARAAQEKLEGGDEAQGRGLVRFSKPFINQYFVPAIRGKKLWEKSRNTYKRKLISAGLKAVFTPDQFIGYKMFLILVFPVIGALLRILEVWDFSTPQILGMGVLGYFYPDLWVTLRINQRHKEIRKAMPFVVDLLAVATEAGLDFLGAIQRVVEKAVKSPLVEELEQVIREIKVGSARAEALKEMATRVNMPEMNSFVAILVSAEQMGSPIGKILRQQSEQIRNERFLRAEKAGARASQALIIPIVFIVLPAVLLIIGAPFVLSMMGAS